jgi:hypothetical protein
VNKFGLCSSTSFRPFIVLTTLKDDDEVDVSHIFAVCIKPLDECLGKYFLFMAHFNDDDIPRVSHRLNEAPCAKTLPEILETPQWHGFARHTQTYIDVIHAYFSHRAFPSPGEALSKEPKTYREVSLSSGLFDLRREGRYQCDE